MIMKTEKEVSELNNNNPGPDYAHLLSEVKERIRSAQYAALKAVNTELVGLYWDIGRMIVERQRDAEHGAAIAEQLSNDLRTEFPGISGFSRRNVFYMREFYLLYRDDKRVQPLVAQIGWTHNLVIFQRCKDSLEREFYLRMTRKFGWSKNVLIHQIDNQSYEKSLLGQTNFDRVLTPELRAQAKLAVKDEYTFDFLELGEEHSERELERALIARIEDFLRAMGGMFAFMGSQASMRPRQKWRGNCSRPDIQRQRITLLSFSIIGSFFPSAVGNQFDRLLPDRCHKFI